MSTESIASSGSASPDTTDTQAPASGTQPNDSQGQASADQQQVADTGDDDAGQSKPEATDAKPKKSRAQRRIEELATQVGDLQRQIRHYEAQAKPKRPPRQLDPLDFPNDAAYNAAVIRQTVEQTQTSFAKTQAQQAAEQSQLLGQQIWEARTEEFAANVPDFENVAFSESVPYSPVMLHIVRGLERGPAVAYYLGKNPDEARRLSKMEPVEATLALGRLDQKLSASQARRITNAPNPVPTVNGKSSSAGFRPDSEDVAGYQKWRDGLKLNG